MHRKLCWVLVLLLLICFGPGAMAQGVTLRTSSSFAGADAGAQAYVDILAEWEAETGNLVDDESASSDEIWKARVLNDFAAGNEPDLFFFFVRTSDNQPLLDKVVPIHEINAAYPSLNLPESDQLREADGTVYAIAVRPYWEGLLVNSDLFERFNLDLPTTKERFETAIRVFSEQGIVPIAASLSDVPHYLTEISILASGPVSDHEARPTTAREIPQSWFDGMHLIRRLYTLGAFSENVTATSEDLAISLFLGKQAAMMVDGSWRANSVAEAGWDTTLVMPFPTYSDDAETTAIIGGTSMGFYITRRAWEDSTKRDAAVSLLARLTTPESSQRLGFGFGGALWESANAMYQTALENGTISEPFQDQMDPDARAYLFGMIPGIAEGTADPDAVLTETITRGAFTTK